MKNLYVDMDGTLCRFYERAMCVEKCREKGFFRALSPYDNLVRAIQILQNSPMNLKDNFRICILSAVYDGNAGEDKEYWIRKYVSEDIPLYFTEVEVSKAVFAGNLFGAGGLTRDDYLLDDYSKNLIDWSEAGGTAVKFGNELNGRGWNGYNFNGHTVYFEPGRSCSRPAQHYGSDRRRKTFTRHANNRRNHAGGNRQDHGK